jgi:8-oxo-dGTP pyrophosphatase MutT (NUDIX family)
VVEQKLLDRIARELESREPRLAEKGSYDTAAAVCLLLRPTGGGLEFLAIKRAERENDPWSGHYALPGGRSEPGDKGLWETAVRETREEVGLDVASVGRLLGQLDDVAPRTRRIPAIAISPFVVAVDGDVVARTSSEVESVVWMPLAVLVEEEHRGVLRLEVSPDREFPTIEYGGHVIWGLTLSILKQMENLLKSIGYPGGGAG